MLRTGAGYREANMYRFWTRSLGIPSRFLLSAVVGSIISMSAMSFAAAGPGECPKGITSSFIDSCYFDFLARTGLEPVTDGSLCGDQPTLPLTRIRIRDFIPDSKFPWEATAHFRIDVTVDEFSKGVRVLFRVWDNDTANRAVQRHCWVLAEGLTVSEQQHCREAILGSAPWRLLCRTGAHNAN